MFSCEIANAAVRIIKNESCNCDFSPPCRSPILRFIEAITSQKTQNRANSGEKGEDREREGE